MCMFSIDNGDAVPICLLADSLSPSVILIYVRDVSQLAFAAIHPVQCLIVPPLECIYLSIDSTEKSGKRYVHFCGIRLIRSFFAPLTNIYSFTERKVGVTLHGKT